MPRDFVLVGGCVSFCFKCTPLPDCGGGVLVLLWRVVCIASLFRPVMCVVCGVVGVGGVCDKL